MPHGFHAPEDIKSFLARTCKCAQNCAKLVNLQCNRCVCMYPYSCCHSFCVMLNLQFESSVGSSPIGCYFVMYTEVLLVHSGPAYIPLTLDCQDPAMHHYAFKSFTRTFQKSCALQGHDKLSQSTAHAAFIVVRTTTEGILFSCILPELDVLHAISDKSTCTRNHLPRFRVQASKKVVPGSSEHLWRLSSTPRCCENAFRRNRAVHVQPIHMHCVCVVTCDHCQVVAVWSPCDSDNVPVGAHGDQKSGVYHVSGNISNT